MYVDESGHSSYKDYNKYFVLSGVIVSDKTVKDLKQKVFDYKLNNFEGDYLDAEIHTHAIYKSKDEFTKISKEKKYELLDGLYECIRTLDATCICIVMAKPLMKDDYDDWYVLKHAWGNLAERFNSFIAESSHPQDKGEIRIDANTKENEQNIHYILWDFKKHGTNYSSLNHIKQEPLFVDSQSAQGIQVADAVAYCTMKHLTKYKKFEPYWNIVYSKLRKNSSGKVSGYGLKIWPHE